MGCECSCMVWLVSVCVLMQVKQMQATTRYIPVSSPFYKTHSQATRTLIKHCKFWLACNKKDYSGYLFGASLLSRSASQRFLEACFWQPVPNTTGGSFCRKTSTVRINPHCSSKHLLIELSGYGMYIYIYIIWIYTKFTWISGCEIRYDSTQNDQTAAWQEDCSPETQ